MKPVDALHVCDWLVDGVVFELPVFTLAAVDTDTGLGLTGSGNKVFT